MAHLNVFFNFASLKNKNEDEKIFNGSDVAPNWNVGFGPNDRLGNFGDKCGERFNREKSAG